MYSLSEIARGVTSPRIGLREMNRLYHTRFGRYPFNPRGIDIFEEDWDNLLILDACRYDYFDEYVDLPGRLEHRISRGGATREFVSANFSNKRLHDTVYVTANSWYLRLQDELDSELYNVVDLHMDPEGKYHDKQFKVITPDVLTDKAVEIADRYPNKRLIVHYIQPHHPFIGPTGSEHFDYPSSSLNEVLHRADTSIPNLHKAYRENVEIVFSSVSNLVPKLEGKTVITADHGEMLGERHSFIPIKDFGHHAGIYNEILTKIPWYITPSDTRKRITVDEPESQTLEVDPDQLERRLADLGYIT